MEFLEQSGQNNCSSYYVPSVQEYFGGLNEYGIILACGGAVTLLISIALYIDTLRYVIRNASSRVKTYTAFVNSVYPVICLLSYFVILVPRSYLLSESLTQVMFAAGIYQLFCLFISYCGGHAHLVNTVDSTRLSLKVGPCCCWPCCSVLPTFEVNKKTVKYMKSLVLQLPLIQGLGYFISLVTWAEDRIFYEKSYTYLQVILMVSIMSGIWGMAMTINLLKDKLDSKFLLVKKFGALQAVLILVKLQGIIAKNLVSYEVISCYPPLTAQTYANLVHNMLIMLEMVLLGLLSRRLYKREIPDIPHDVAKNNNISNVFENTVAKINGSSMEGIENDGLIL